MTMHLVRGMSALNTKRRKPKRKPGWKEAEEKHDKWLRKMGAHPDQLKKTKKEFKEYVPQEPYRRKPNQDVTIASSDSICGYAPRKDPNVYTGDYIVGIGTMHKSNLVPVTSKEDAKQIATMRRN